MDKNSEPLAARMRPETLSEYAGQRHILGEGMVLSRMIEADRLCSMILYGPPGTGKTSLAAVIAASTKADFQTLSAVTAGKRDIESAVARARKILPKKTVLFTDEIHRFNRTQQDALLPFVESGLITLIGATTENPYFEVNRALLSRCMVFELKPLAAADLRPLLQRALPVLEQDTGAEIRADPEALDFLAEMAAGDARRGCSALELAALTTPPEDGVIHITLKTAENCIQKKAVPYDRNGDCHYDTISAFIKSMRGSDPDAALYYLARMLAAGEDPAFIARRIMIHACEDVGLADPSAIVTAQACCAAVEKIGMPEARILLAEAALCVAKAPKSNSSAASIDRAMKLMEFASDLEIPPYLKDAHYGGAEKLNRGIGYLYPHDFPDHWVFLQFFKRK